MLPVDAAAGYKSYLDPFRNTVKIGMPNVLWNNYNSSSSGGNYSSRTWTKYFLGNCTSCHFDFAAIHYYQDCEPADGADGAAWFQSNVTDAYNTLRLPIWVTEFQCYGTETQQIKFLQSVLPWMDAQSFVDRYAYFGTFPEMLINEHGTGLSAMGTAYATI